MNKLEKNKFINAGLYPLLFITIIGLIFFIQSVFELPLYQYGIFPRTLKGLIGIIAAPLLHGDIKHLFNNSIPLLILGTALFYFYKEIAFKVSVWIYLMVGIWTWVSAREAYHIGASGLLYGLFSFLLVSGFIRKSKQLIALSFVVIFIYGSLVWGILPIDIKISFEGHLWGFVAGIVLAIYYRRQGPQEKEYTWQDDDIDEEDDYWNKGEDEVTYIYKPRQDKT